MIFILPSQQVSFSFTSLTVGQTVSEKVTSNGPLAAVGALLGVAGLMALVFLVLFITVTL